jgi:hypothetical protein
VPARQEAELAFVTALSAVPINQINSFVEQITSSVFDSPFDYITTQLQHLASWVIRCPQSALLVFAVKSNVHKQEIFFEVL